jgi:L-fuculose-phosphate aldolase
MKYIDERKLICEIGRRMYEREFVASNDGNISCRVDDNQMLITPSGVSKGFMQPNEIVLMDFEGKVLEGRNPSSEFPMHTIVYKTRPEINAVCHAHPAYTTAFAICEVDINQPILQEVILTLGEIVTIPYAITGSNHLAENLEPNLEGNSAFLLKNHGALTIGQSLIDSFHKLETLEHFAKIQTITKQLGKVTLLNSDEVESLNRKRCRNN